MTLVIAAASFFIIVCLGGIGTELEGIREELRGIKWRIKKDE